MKMYSGFDALPTGQASDKITKGCLVLEGGAFRGVYTSGVLDVFMENDINLEAVIGTSAGALNGINYVSGQIGRSARVNLGFRHDSRYVSGFKGLLGKKGMLNIDFVFEDYEEYEPLDRERFINSPQRYIAVATGMDDGQARYFEKGKCTELINGAKASSSMPLVSKPVSVEGALCLDGCMSDPIPLQFALDEGYEKIVVVRTVPADYRKAGNEDEAYAKAFKDYPEFAAAIRGRNELYNKQCDLLERLEKEGRLIQIYPTVRDDVDKLEADMEKLGKLYYQGYKDAMEALPRLEDYLGLEKKNL